MEKVYLLVFVKECQEVPVIENLELQRIQGEPYSVLWTPSPTKRFKDKTSFIYAMVELYRILIKQRNSMLPISLGTRVNHPNEILLLLDKYKALLDKSMQYISGCCEYSLVFQFPDQMEIKDFGVETNPSSGKEYLLKRRIKYHEEDSLSAHIKLVGNQLKSIFNPWLKNIILGDINQQKKSFEIALLIDYQDIQEFEALLKAHHNEENDLLYFTGPWPPFHFSAFSFQVEPFMIRETMIW